MAKNRTPDHTGHITAMVMELFGGLGFLEEYTVARWHREALITPIWEGPSNIQALDMLEVLQKKRAYESFLEDFIPMLERAGTAAATSAREMLERTLSTISACRSPEEAQWYAISALASLADCAQVGLLYQLAEKVDGRYGDLADLYATRFLTHQEYPARAMDLSWIWEG